MNHYSIFGLSLGADFELPELLPAPTNPAPTSGFSGRTSRP